MLVYIPMAFGNFLHPSIRATIELQSIDPVTIVEVYTDGVFPSQQVHTEARYRGEVNSRNRCIHSALLTKADIIFMQDPDITHNSTYNFSRMLNALSEDENLGAVALCKAGHNINDGHIDIGCIALRTKVAGPFRMNGLSCLCDTFREDIEAQGYRVAYLPIKDLITEMFN
jgi:hypothetical protein